MRPAAIVLILCAGLLAACSGATLPFSKATDAPPARSPPAIFVPTITGLPAGQETAVFQALASAAADRGIRLGSGRAEDEFALTGEFEEFASSAGRAVRYRWTLTDATGRVLHRIEETEAMAGPSGDVPIARIAAYTAENLSSRLSQLGYATRAAGMPPPLDHLARAGPGADREIDYETLHGPGGPSASDSWAGEQASTSQQTTAESEPKAAGADQSIQGVTITRVEGAGESGNAELSAALARVLTDAGWPVMQRPGSKVLAIEGDVTLSQPTGEAQKVALRWTVKAPNGDILGAVEQANDVPAGSLDETWGKAADHAALAAAQGIFDLVDKLR